MWTEEDVVTKYNLAYINHLICQQDNGRVLGYDNAHEHHERHYMGVSGSGRYESYRKTFETFVSEVNELKELQ